MLLLKLFELMHHHVEVAVGYLRRVVYVVESVVAVELTAEFLYP